MTVIIAVIVGIVLVLLTGYLLIFKGVNALSWAVSHPLATIFIIVVCIPMIIIGIFLLLGLII